MLGSLPFRNPTVYGKNHPHELWVPLALSHCSQDDWRVRKSVDFDEKRSDLLPTVAAVLLVLLLVGGGLWWLVKGQKVEVSALPSGETPAAEDAAEALELRDGIEDSSEEILRTLGVSVDSVDPNEVAKHIADLLVQGDFESLKLALDDSGQGLSAETLQALQAQAGQKGLRLKNVREVGELEINKRKRFAVEFEDGAPPLFLDLTREEGAGGKWSIEQARVPDLAQDSPDDGASPTQEEEAQIALHRSDSLTVSDEFLQAALAQEFAKAKTYVAASGVSDAKIAALCILFEEGQYQLNPEKPLRALFTRDHAAAYLANVLTKNGEESAQFGMNLTRAEPGDPWQISEINLDALLADYAGRVAGGDIYYTPLVSNPKGGDTLVIFFGFDEETLAPRTTRQLDVVAEILQTDPGRKLTISGHADALGTADYNRELSRKRATAVRNYLITHGVTADQVILEVAGESRPRRPNETASGEDNPEGRRANRRTEIYLDF